MFAAQPFTDASRKRGRDDDDETVGGMLSFGEHRTKRLQCLPLRSSPTSSKRWSAPSFPPTSFPIASRPPHTITPSDSDSEEAPAAPQPKSHFSPWSSSPAMSQQPSPFQPDADDMMMDAASPPPSGSSQPPQQQHLSSPNMQGEHLEPGPFHAEPIASTIASRMPTPIQPSFASQIRGTTWGGPGPALQHPHGVVNMGHRHDGLALVDDRTIPRTLDGGSALNAADWQAVQQHRRLPSPISEGEDMCSPTGLVDSSMMSPQMVLDGTFPHELSAKLQLHERNHHHSFHRPPHTLDDLGMMDVEDPHDSDLATTTLMLTQTTSAPEVNSAPATPTPGIAGVAGSAPNSAGRRGHMRSRHTVNTWTWQPGMKKSFSIGYRADCEKCRLKVPGHFNHIIIS